VKRERRTKAKRSRSRLNEAFGRNKKVVSKAFSCKKKRVEEGVEEEETERTKKPINDRNPHNRGYDAFRYQICHATNCKP
jgi:hypothetical protein